MAASFPKILSRPGWDTRSVGGKATPWSFDTTGFNDKTWLDGSGHPHSDAMHLIERFRRRDIGHMDIQITIDDPKAYTKPLTYTQSQRLLPDSELIEYICNENYQKPLGNIIGK